MRSQVYRTREEFLKLALLHRYNAIGVGVLLASGLLLFAEPLRGLLAPVRVPLKYLHLASGGWLTIYAVVRAAEWGSFLVRQGLQAGRRANTLLTAAWLLGWAVSGVLMYLRGQVPYTVSNTATFTHDWLTWLSLPWLLLHIAFRMFKVRRLGERVEVSGWLAAPTTRRALLWGGAVAAGAWLLSGLFRSNQAAIEPAGPKVDPATLAGGGMKGRFRLYFVNDMIPTFNSETWRLQVGPKSYTWEQLLALPRTVLVRNFHCVTGWSVFNVTWEGVRLKDILADAGLPASPALLFHSGDGEYIDSLTAEQALHPDAMLAYQMEGAPLPRLQGGPLRLLVPNMYGYKSVKWVEAITPFDNPGYRGYWQQRGYSVDAYLERNEPVQGGAPGSK